MQKVLEQFIFLSVFLLAGYGVRVWFEPAQRLFLPASLIGGIIGLVLCPNGFGVIPVTPEMMKELGALPGILITVVITASVLGVKLPKPGELAGGLARNFMHLNVFFMAQIGIGMQNPHAYCFL
jgi:glutamate:Na+ symporter, ESS family